MVEKDKVAFSVDAAGKAVGRSVSVRKPVRYNIGDQGSAQCKKCQMAFTPGITMLRPVIRHEIVQMNRVAVVRGTDQR